MKHKHKIIWSSVVFFLMIAALIGLTSVGENAQSTDKKIRIGYTNYDILIGLKTLQYIEQRVGQEGYSVEWIEFKDEVEIYKSLEKGTIDFGKVGDAVPSFLHKGKNTPLFVAGEPSNPNARAIAVSKGAEIDGVEDLVAKKVAYTSYTNDHYFLLQLLAESDLGAASIDKIISIEATPSEGVELLQAGKVDALVTSEPFVSLLDYSKYRLIYDGELPANQDVYLTTQENGEKRKEITNQVLAVIYEYEELLINDPHRWAEILYQKTKIPHIVWLNVFTNKSYGVSPFYEGMLKQQQAKIDFLFKQKVIQQNFDVTDYAIEINTEEWSK